MAFELFPTPTWLRPAFSIPFYVECKKFPRDEEMAPRPLVPSFETGAITTFWASDSNNLFFVVDVTGQINTGRDRAWRYGDGVLLTVSKHSQPEPVPCYTSFGFGGTSRKPQTVCTNRNGVWFPQQDCSKIVYRLHQDKDKARFSIAIPWSAMEPLRPLLYETISLNLTFVRQTETSFSVFQLLPDTDYDTESTNLRRLLPVQFSVGNIARPLAQSYLTRSCWRGAEPIQVNLGLFNPETCPARLDFTITDGTNIIENHSSSVELAPGRHHWTLRWNPQGLLPTGKYHLEISGQGSGKNYRKNHDIFVLSPQELSALRNDLLNLEEDINCLHPSSVHTALARLEWLEIDLDKCSWQEPDLSVFNETQQIRDALQRRENPIADKTGLSRRGFRSQVDGKLQAYSQYLPKGFTLGQKWPLLMFLHGSGVDEQGLAANPELHKLADRLGLILLFPRARTASGFYLGADERDVMQNLAVIKKRLPLDWDKTFIGGFSMGGFGAWRIGLRHPGHFAGIAVVSGIPCLPCAGVDYSANDDFNPLDFADNAKRLALFVAHGAKDSAVSIEPVREITGKLKELGVELTFKEYPCGEHSNNDWPTDLAVWLKTILSRGNKPGQQTD